MSKTVIKVENLSKQYRLGEIGTGSLSHDINRWWHTVRGKEDPYLKIGEANDRSAKGQSEYVWSLKDINFEIKQGDAVGIIGKNGAGKSTLLKILSRVTAPTTGSVKVKGRIASLLEVGTGFHPELSGRDNIFLNGAILGMRKEEVKRKFEEIVDFAGVERYIDTPVKRYSSGMYVRLAFAVAAHLESEILIVDEVLAVGDYEFQKKCIGKMDDVSSKEGRTVLFVSHNMSVVRNLCKSGILLQTGNIIFQGNSNDAVDFYSTNVNTVSDARYVEISSKHRRYETQRDVEFISVEYSDEKEDTLYATTESITVLLTIRAIKDLENCRIAASINKTDETCIGVFFSQEILNLKRNEPQKIKLKINDHNLAKGKYYFDFSLGKGNETTGLKDFDIISQVIYFEIAYKDNISKEMYLMWENNWGSINFQNTEISII